VINGSEEELGGDVVSNNPHFFVHGLKIIVDNVTKKNPTIATQI
jgi:hypothetical protein